MGSKPDDTVQEYISTVHVAPPGDSGACAGPAGRLRPCQSHQAHDMASNRGGEEGLELSSDGAATVPSDQGQVVHAPCQHLVWLMLLACEAWFEEMIGRWPR